MWVSIDETRNPKPTAKVGFNRRNPKPETRNRLESDFWVALRIGTQTDIESKNWVGFFLDPETAIVGGSFCRTQAEIGMKDLILFHWKDGVGPTGIVTGV